MMRLVYHGDNEAEADADADERQQKRTRNFVFLHTKNASLWKMPLKRTNNSILIDITS